MGALDEVELIEMNWCYELQTAKKDLTFQTKSINKIQLVSYYFKVFKALDIVRKKL